MYDREMKDIFAIQEEIAMSIAQTLEVTLDSEGQPLRSAGTNNLEAFKLYVRGRSFLFQRGARLHSAIDCLKKAVSLDPNYALAWSGLADAYHGVGFYGLASPENCMPQGMAAAARSIELNPSLAEAHMSLAMSLLLHDWDRAGAEREFLRSLELKPQNSFARSCYGLYYLQWAVGRFAEGLAQAAQAIQIDPLSAWSRAILGVTYLPVDGERSLEVTLESLRIEPDSYLGRWTQMTALNLLGRLAEAAEVGESALRMFGRPLWVMASLARTYARLGKHADAEALYMELKWRAKREYVGPTFLGLAAFSTGEKDEAARLLQHAHAINEPTLIGIKYWPDLAEWREDPRFQEILKSRGWS
jgi:tetratricopeptide (TPR) repeat protein